jgi:phage recombination protein Bet
MTALDVRQPAAALAIRAGQDMWDDKQRAALAVLGIKDATNADLAVFMHVCQRTGLDPFSRQIYMINRRSKEGDQWVTKQTIQVGIDGFRVIRDRVAARLGVSVEYEDTIWYDADGSEHRVWLWEHAPAACNVTVVKDGRRFPGVVRTASYAATNKQGDMIAQWKTQPDHMIEKCAEAFALRRAFPHDLGGVALDDEMPQPEHAPAQNGGRVTAAEITSRRDQRPKDPSPAGEPQAPAADAPPTPPADPAGEAPDRPAPASSGQRGIIHKHFERLGYSPDSPDDRQARLRVTAILAQVDDLSSSNELDQDQAARVIRWLEKCADGAALELMLAEGEVSDE